MQIIRENLAIENPTMSCSEALFDADIYILMEADASIKIFSLKNVVFCMKKT